jgi:hypothetical protein
VQDASACTSAFGAGSFPHSSPRSGERAELTVTYDPERRELLVTGLTNDDARALLAHLAGER